MEFYSTEVTMFRLARTILSLLLIAATALVSVAPEAGACGAMGRGRESKRCCCAGGSSAACCTASAPRAGCQCAVDQERPATPPQRQTSDDRNDARQIECVAILPFADKDEHTADAAQDVSLLSSQPALRRQAILCRWLI